MHKVGACGHGGWALVMKTDGAKVLHISLFIQSISRVIQGDTCMHYDFKECVNYMGLNAHRFNINGDEVKLGTAGVPSKKLTKSLW